MASTTVKERLGQDVTGWYADGLIPADTLTVLRDRYEVRRLGLGLIIKYTGIVGGVLAGSGLVGLIAAMADSEGLNLLFAIAAAAVITWLGLRLSSDPRARYPESSKVLLTLGVAGLTGSLALLVDLMDLPDDARLITVGLGGIATCLVLAHLYRNAYLLILAVLGFFHWVGAWHEMVGRSTYSTDIQDPRAMAVVAAAVVGLGLIHERYLQRQTHRFFKVYQALGLVYLNLSLLILSIEAGPANNEKLWMVVLTAVCVGELVLGAYLKSALFRGFGLTFLGIDLFTRYFESMWDRLAAGPFFLAGGLALFGLGFAFEAWSRRQQPPEPPVKVAAGGAA